MYGQQLSNSQYPEEGIPEEVMSPGGYAPPTDLPPDALYGLVGGAPDMSAYSGMGGGMAGGGGEMGGMPGGDQAMMGGGMEGLGGPAGSGAPGGMSPNAGMMAGSPGPDPMMAVRDQFGQIAGALQMLTQAYPAAAPALMEASNALARGMLMVAQSVQPEPAMPPTPA